ncbi:MAG TPA: thiamine phosphate synthase [Persephonella sp.]|nr:thiamine phosphate synthase [Hydrogenothermaceae bacterium]HIQ25491.1 thiamine phosphate synthase [Persephonella sp.]
MFNIKVLYAITDEHLLKEDFTKKVEKALKFGVDIIQYRAKKKDAKDMIEEAIALKKLCIKYNVPLIINDRIDIALAIDADGVHVGQEDIPVLYVRKLIGNNKILGLSTKNLNHVEEANKLPVDYIGFGSIFPTNTKENAKVAGLEKLKKAVEISLQPVIAIGGINENNIDEVLKTGCSGVAIVSAIFAGENIEENTKNLKEKIKNY